MFGEIQPDRSWFRRNGLVCGSVTIHLLALAVIVFHNPQVIDFTASWLAHGDGSKTYQITYISPGMEATSADVPKLSLPAVEPKLRPAPKFKRKIKPPVRPIEANAEAGDHDSHAGSPLGTVLDGPIKGHEVRIALPVFPEPQVDRADLPRNLVGDVVIEVTIDAQGKVVDTKIVRSIGHEIDEKIEATIRRRRYQPALLDGVPVASRQDVHFHFPS